MSFEILYSIVHLDGIRVKASLLDHKMLNVGKQVSLVLLIYVWACAQQPLNDFFGITMNPENSSGFIIKDYSEQTGVQYISAQTMNTNLFAWAEIGVNTMKIKVVNNSDEDVLMDYHLDRFTLVNKNHEEFTLYKGDEYHYPSKNRIKPYTSVEFLLEYPLDFWQSVGMKPSIGWTGKEEKPAFGNYLLEFWKGQNQLRFDKDDIVLLTVKLGGEATIVLKPVPGSD